MADRQNITHNNNTVEIAMPVFNGEQFIVEAIESLRKQSYENIIIKVYDNCSNDNTQQIVKNFMSKDKRISLISNPYNIGPVENYKKAWRSATCRFFMWAACDDIWDADWVSQIQKQRSKECISVRGSIVPFNENGHMNKIKLKNFKHMNVISHFIDNEKNGKGYYLYGIIDRDLLPKEFDFLDDSDLNFSPDTFISLNLLKYGNLSVIEDTQQFIRRHSKNDGINQWNNYANYKRIISSYPLKYYKSYIRHLKPSTNVAHLTYVLLLKYVKSQLELFGRIIRNLWRKFYTS